MIRIGLCKFRIPAHDSRSLRRNPSHHRLKRIAQNLQPLSTDIGAAPTPAAAEAARVIVTGSNIPTAEEVGPNPVEPTTARTSTIR